MRKFRGHKRPDKSFEYVDLDVIDLDKEDFDENKSGSDKLNIYQEKELNFINKRLDTEATKAKQFIKEKKITKLKQSYDILCKTILNNRKEKDKFLAALFISVVITEILGYTIIKDDTQNNINFVESAKTYLNVGMYNDTNLLSVSIPEVSIKTNDNNYIGINYIDWISTDIDTNSEKYIIADTEYNISKNTILNNLILTDSLIYQEYKNSEETANKEFYLSTNKPTDIDTTGFKSVTNRFYEKSSLLSIKAFTNSYHNTFLFVQENLGGGELTIQTLEAKISNWESKMYESNQYDGIIINLEEFKELHLKKLSNTAGVKYNATGNIISVYDAESNIDYFYISSIDNESFGCYREELLGTADENIYLTYEFDNESDIDYLTFGIKTDNNLYVIKINPEFKDLVTEWFKSETGKDIMNTDVSKVQRVIYKE